MNKIVIKNYMNKNKIIVGVIVAVIVGGGLFYGGMKFGQAEVKTGNQARATGQFQNATSGRNGANFAGGGNRAGALTGEILSKDDKSLTIKLSNGGSKIVFTSASTTILKTAQGSIDDLTAGINVVIVGASNSDGSETAQSIQIRPTNPMR